MNQQQKVIRGKVGLLELAKQLGKVSHACGEYVETQRRGDGSTELTTARGPSLCQIRFRLSHLRERLGHKWTQSMKLPPSVKATTCWHVPLGQ